LLFGLCSSLSFLGSLWSEGRLQRWLRASRFGRLLQVAGCGVGFFVAAYTGVLLTATNQPLWSDTRWIGALFLTSAASTGLALLLFLGHARRAGEAVMHRLERADRWALLLELAAFAALLGSLGPVLGPVLRTSHGLLLVVGVLVIGIGAPFLCHLFSKGRRGVLTAAALVLAGGFVLRYAILSTPPELLVRGAVAAEGASTLIGKEHVSERMPRSPEDGRRSGAPGADPGNRPAQLRPRSKVFSDD
jgi:formate-dependent nitrite reductase membrane component NrfD